MKKISIIEGLFPNLIGEKTMIEWPFYSELLKAYSFNNGIFVFGCVSIFQYCFSIGRCGSLKGCFGNKKIYEWPFSSEPRDLGL